MNMTYLKCCRVWPYPPGALLEGTGRCGLCSEQPVPLDENPLTVQDYADLHEQAAAARRRVIELEATQSFVIDEYAHRVVLEALSSYPDSWPAYDKARALLEALADSGMRIAVDARP